MGERIMLFIDLFNETATVAVSFLFWWVFYIVDEELYLSGWGWFDAYNESDIRRRKYCLFGIYKCE